MAEMTHVVPLLLVAATACGSGTGTPVGGDVDAATDVDAAPTADAAPGLPLPTARRDLSGWTCRTDGARQPVAFVDADSTLRISKAGSVTPSNAADVDILPFAADKLADLDHQGYLVAIVSNQAGVSTGHETFADAEQGLAFTIAQLGRDDGRIQYFDFAEYYDGDRKPMTGMATRLDGLLVAKCGAGIDKARSLMIGDSAYQMGVDGPSPDGRPADDHSNADRLFAQNLGVSFAEPTDAFGWRAFAVYNLLSVAQLRSFVDAVATEATRLDGTGQDPTRAAALHEEVTETRALDGL